MKKKKAVKAAVERERRRCAQVAYVLAARLEGMGYHHDAGKAAGARAVFEALGGREDLAPYIIQHVAGVTTVVGDY